MNFSVRLTLTHFVNRAGNLIRYIKGIRRVKEAVPVSSKGISDCIVLIHMGSRDVPPYAADCIEQIRLLSDIPVYFILSKSKKITKRLAAGCNIIYLEDLPLSKAHHDFYRKMSSLRAVFDNFFQSALERFYVLDEAIKYLGLKNVIHMENDILLYEDPQKLIGMLKGHYGDMTVPRMNEKDSMASVMFIPDEGSLLRFLTYINDHIYDKGCNDMNLLAAYMREKGLPSLPVIYEEYLEDNILENKKGEKAPDEHVSDYYLHAGEYGGFFDAAPLGQFIGGTDKKPAGVTDNRGFINQAAFIDPSRLDIKWEKRDQGFVPTVHYKEKTYRIFNLHVHCKDLRKYRSDSYEEV